MDWYQTANKNMLRQPMFYAVVIGIDMEDASRKLEEHRKSRPEHINVPDNLMIDNLETKDDVLFSIKERTPDAVLDSLSKAGLNPPFNDQRHFRFMFSVKPSVTSTEVPLDSFDAMVAWWDKNASKFVPTR